MEKKEIASAADFHQDWHFTKKNLYDKCGFELRELKLEEGKAYGACCFKLDGKTILFRVAKLTPKKTGQFVAIWKRNEQGITQPFEDTDEIDFMVISIRDADNFGQFIFPETALLKHGIISNGQREGKRGIRVYPPWDKVSNKQAETTQSWQAEYFLNIGTAHAGVLDLLCKKLV
ncbi:MepB family protein [Pedobacter foliorum]|uniref:MepB family protein n=1 Tax=Pedobacter foliorum TaxID=2739058 RepID=UPI0015676446|nr:MepB family protein [Pedobacter foliorum]NRF37489.1 MepB family protein [Pedobacter foliorum]